MVVLDVALLTGKAFLLVFGLFLAIQRVEGAGRAVGEERGELLRLQLLLDPVELTATRWHWWGGRREGGEGGREGGREGREGEGEAERWEEIGRKK